MRLEKFEEWFAVRVDHSDKEFWPGRVTYDPTEGITLTSVNFSDPKHWYSNPTFEADTITGYLDYQRPATIISPFIQGAFPGTLGSGLAVRSSYSVVGNGIIKNFHLQSLKEQCFRGFRVYLPSFHAWIAPRLVRKDYQNTDGLPALSVSIEKPLRRSFEINGTEIEILSHASAAGSGDTIPLNESTRLSVILSNAVDYEEVMRLAAITDIVFAFMVGTRLETAVHYLPVSASDQDDGGEERIASVWVVPAWKREPQAPHWLQRLFVERTSPVDVSTLLSFCLRSHPDIVYLMDIILAAESSDLKTDDCFGELLGCLEDFDKVHLGSGRDPAIRAAKRRLRSIVQEHGNEADLVACDRLGDAFRNEFSLRQRLDRLIKIWRDDGFRGNPDVKRIVEIRNIKPHGRGRDLSPAVFREIQIFTRFLCALARYHLFKHLGFDRRSIGECFSRKAYRYGVFVPVDLRPNN